MDHLINNDRKLPPEYNLPHTYVEMQVREPSQAWRPGAESSWVWVGQFYLQRALGTPRAGGRGWHQESGLTLPLGKVTPTLSLHIRLYDQGLIIAIWLDLGTAWKGSTCQSGHKVGASGCTVGAYRLRGPFPVAPSAESRDQGPHSGPWGPSTLLSLPAPLSHSRSLPSSSPSATW